MPIPVTVRPELVTTAPLFVGGGATAEIGRFRVGVAGGAMPRPYVDAIEASIGLLWSGWTSTESDLVDAVLQSSAVGRVTVGARPWKGLYADASGTLVGLGGSATPATLITAVTGRTLPEPQRGELPLVVDARANLGLLGADVGWDQRVWKQLHVRGDLGWSFTVASSTHLVPSSPAARVEDALQTVATEGEVLLDDTFTAYAHPPTLTVAIGWDFPVQK